MVHYILLLAHWLSLWYTSIFYWPNGYLCGTLLSYTDLLALPMLHCRLLLASLPYGMLIHPFVHAIVYYYLLLAHLLSLWYSSIFY